MYYFERLDMIEIAAYLLIGSLAGFLGGLLGVGGGAIVVPCLVYIFSHSSSPHQNAMQLAIGTSLAAMIFTSGSSALAHYKKNGLTIHLVKFLAPGVIIGSMLGALIAGMIPSQDLKLIFGIIVSLLGI